MQLLIIDIDLAHLGLNPLSCLLFERHRSFLLLDRVSLVRDSGVSDPSCKSRTFSQQPERPDGVTDVVAGKVPSRFLASRTGILA